MAEEQDRERIKDLVGEMDCPYDFLCAEGGLERLLSVQEFDGERYLECFECTPEPCPLATERNGSRLCACELRIHIARELSRSPAGPRPGA